MKKNGFTMTELLIVVVLVFAILIPATYGYINNIVQFSRLDFKSPYKAEVLRGVGIVMPVVGVVEGYMKIEDK